MVSKMNGRGSERGSILITSAVAMSSLILMAGLVIDISHFYVVKTELQNAVDAAALAGASGLNGEASGINTAMCRAVTTLNANKYSFNKRQFVNGTNLSCATLEGSLGASVTFSVSVDSGFMSKEAAVANPNAINFVRVNAPDVNVPIFFATMVLGGTRSLAATATAGLSPSTNLFCDLASFSVVECDDPSAPGCSLATLPSTQVLRSDGVTPCPSQTQFTKGCIYTVKPGTSGSEGPAPGSYQPLAVSSLDDFAAAGAVNTCVKPDDCIRVDAGTVGGLIVEGINTRFDEDSPAPDTNRTENITHNDYLLDTINRPNRRRELLVPIIQRSPLAGQTGVVDVCAWQLGRFFIRQRAASTGNEMTLEYIERRTVGGRGGFVPGAGIGNPDFVTPVLYR